MMKTLTKIGIVLVVLTMVTSNAIASEKYIGPQPGPPEDPSWCTEANWDDNMPRAGRKDDVKIRNGNTVVIDCVPAMIGYLEIRNGGCQVGTEDEELTEAPWFIPGVYVDLFYVDEDLEMADDNKNNFGLLDIVNGNVYIEDQSKDVGRKGDIEINVAAGSSLLLDSGVYFGDSNDGTNSVYTLNIAGDFKVDGSSSKRFEHRGGHLIVNLTGGTFDHSYATARLSADDDSQMTVDITGGGTYITDKIELGKNDDGVKAPFTYSLAIKVSDGTWDGAGEEIKDEKDGQILKIDVTGNGTFLSKDLNINNDGSEIHITMDSGTIDISDDIEMNAGTIVITGGEFNVEDNFDLGDDGVATMTVSGTAEVFIDDLYMADDSALTVDGVRVDLDSLKEMGSGASIDITAGGSLVIADADDQDDWDEIADWIDAGQIGTSEEGMVIVWDYGVSHDEKLTIRPVIPVDIDIQPGGCPNPLRVNFIGGGVYPVAIVGGDLDVLDIDVSTITLHGVSPKRSSYTDVSTSGENDCGNCGTQGPDGTLDLQLKFDRIELLDALEASLGDLGLLAHRFELTLTLDAELYEALGAKALQGTDCLVISNRGAIKRKK